MLGKPSPSKYKTHHEELHSLRISLNCESFGESYHESAYENVYNKKTPPSLQTRSDGLVQQATLSYDVHTHLRNNCYLTQPYSIYPPFQSDKMSIFSAYPRIIKPTSLHLSVFHVDIYPNSSNRTYDKHHIDSPIGLETDLK